jgi:hypothetical protein
VHLAREGLGGQLITDTGALSAAGAFEDVLLNSLAVIKPSRGHDLGAGVAALRSSSGILVAVTGKLSAGAARQLAASRRGTSPAIALLLAVSTWSGQGQDLRPAGGAADGRNGQGGPGGPGPAETDEAAAILRAAGWRVASRSRGSSWACWRQTGRRRGEQ